MASQVFALVVLASSHTFPNLSPLLVFPFLSPDLSHVVLPSFLGLLGVSDFPIVPCVGIRDYSCFFSHLPAASRVFHVVSSACFLRGFPIPLPSSVKSYFSSCFCVLECSSSMASATYLGHLDS